MNIRTSGSTLGFRWFFFCSDCNHTKDFIDKLQELPGPVGGRVEKDSDHGADLNRVLLEDAFPYGAEVVAPGLGRPEHRIAQMKADPLHQDFLVAEVVGNQAVVDVRCSCDVSETDIGDSALGDQGDCRLDNRFDDGIFSARLIHRDLP